MSFSTHVLWLEISRTQSGAWDIKISDRPPARAIQIRLDRDEPEVEATTVVSDAIAGVRDLIWRHELAAIAYQKQLRSIGLAQQLAAAALNNSVPVAAILEDRQEARNVVYALRSKLSQNAKVRGLWLQTWQAYLKWYCAAAPAWLALVASVVRYGGSDPEAVQSDKVVHAVHGEWQTRTRHLLLPRYEASPRSTYVILGRPRQRLAKLARIINPAAQSNGSTVVRPLDLRAVLSSFPCGIQKFAAGVEDAACSPIQFGFRDSVGLAFRIFQGAAHRHWWARRSGTPHTVVFGHTGNADTSQLEMEMQANGTRTIHVAHGVNHGWPFAGVSSLGLFLSEHDAGLARSIGAYKKTAALATQKPAHDPGGRGWLILTSYTHPMGRSYAADGVELDARALQLVADAARIAGLPPQEVVWRPHPSIAHVPPRDQLALEELAASHGFTVWPPNEPLEHMKAFAAIITTPSTIILDALGLGKCPILISAAHMQKDIMYAAYPIRAHNAADLARLCTTAGGRECFSKAWDSITPGRLPTRTADLPL